ncbi:MAG: DUF3800 domain-containing protein [Deferribacterales bacterium]
MSESREKLYIFCDEACVNDKFILYGGFICNYDTQCSIQDELYKYKESHGLNREIKWNHCKAPLYDRYIGFVDIIFRYINEKKLAFKFMSVERAFIDYKTYYGNDKELGFYNLYQMQLLHQFCVPYYNESLKTKFFIRLDARTTKYSLENVRNNLNNKLKYKKKILTYPVVNIEPRDSKKCIHIQLNDVILGAACFIKNDKFKDKHISDAKKDMALYIQEKSRISFKKNQSSLNGQMSFWCFKLKTAP